MRWLWVQLLYINFNFESFSHEKWTHPLYILISLLFFHRSREQILRRHMCDLIVWKLFNGYCHKMGASSIQYSAYFYITRTDFIRQLSRPRTSRWRFLLLWRRPTVVLSRPRSSSWPSRSSSCHGVASPSFVPTFVVRWPPLLPPSCRWPTPAGRRGPVRTAVLPPRFSHATSVRHWPTWATHLYRITI